jgi:hypothetical protein
MSGRHRIRATLIAIALVVSLLSAEGGALLAQGRGQGQERQPAIDGAKVAASVRIVFSTRERDIIRAWYRDHLNNLPPGLAKRDRLPPGLEKKIFPLPADLVCRLPPPPPGCNRVLVGGMVILMEIGTSYVHAILRLDV